MKKIIAGILAVFALVYFCAGVNAQEKIPPEDFFGPSLVGPPSVVPNGAVNCFDYYKFGSVQVDVSPSVASAVSGIPITFSGKIKNLNSYLITGGEIYVKIFRKQGDQEKAMSNGNFLVDFFSVENDLNIQANEEKPIEFTWNIPNYIQSGEYQAVMFFVVNSRYNLLGLTFTDDVVGNSAEFSVIGETQGGVEFDKNSVKLNDRDYHFTAYPPRINPENSVNISTMISNATQQQQEADVTWSLYAWDSLLENKLIKKNSEKISLKTGEKKELLYDTSEASEPVYLLVVESVWKDSKSILFVRFVRDGIEKSRINFPGIVKFPIKNGEKNSLFTCAHNSGHGGLIENQKIILTLIDDKGKEIHKYSYQGGITGAMMGLKDDFIPDGNYDHVFLKTELYDQNNKLIDSSDSEYDCAKIDSKTCYSDSDKDISVVSSSEENSNRSNEILYFIFVLIFIIFLGIIFWSSIRNKKKNKENRMDKFGIFILFFIGFTFLGIDSARASSAVSTASYDGTLCYQASDIAWRNLYYIGLMDPVISATYNAYVYNDDTDQLIVPNSAVLIGTKLRFEQSLGGISYVGRGETSDTPQGTWIDNADFPDGPTFINQFFKNPYLYNLRDAQCSDKYYVGSIDYFNYGDLDIYIPLAVDPSNISIQRDSDSQAKLSCSGNICTVLSVGIIKTDFNFSDTDAKFYYEYEGGDSFVYPGCHTSYDIKPMGTCESYGGSTGRGLPYYTASTPATITIPAQTISYNLNATASNNPPSVPIIDGPESGFVNTEYSFNFTSTDSDGDTIKYGIDWNNDDVINHWNPASTFVASGVSMTASRQWPLIGAKTFQVNACDSNGNCSDFASHSIDISEAECIYLNYHCSKTADIDCSLLPLNCGKTSNTTAQCFATESCGGVESTVTKPISECGNNCINSSEICPVCSGSGSNWREVAP